MFWDLELTERKKKILKVIIDDYIDTALPVGSRTIAKKNELGLSSATIRNEMSDLEELGYLSQPHTSAGRVPSDKGYRFYVDHLMQLDALAVEEIKKIKSAMEIKVNELNYLIKRASNIISNITGYTSLAISPQLKKTVLKAVQVVPVDENKALVIVVAGAGVVRNAVVRLNKFIDSDLLLRISNVLNEKIAGMGINELNMPSVEYIEKITDVDSDTVLAIIEGVRKCIRAIDQSEIYLQGATNLLNYPEFNDLLKARELLEILNENEVIEEILRTALNKHRINVQIGKENELETIKDCSLVTTVYSFGDMDLGSIGVIGPTRMAYSRVVSSINYIKKILNREILRIFGDNEG